jgi:hypothetical protein
MTAASSAGALVIEFYDARTFRQAGHLEVGKVGRREQEVLEIGLAAAEAAILLDTDHDRHVLTMPRDDLRSVVVRLSHDFAEALLGFLELPAHLFPLIRPSGDASI